MASLTRVCMWSDAGWKRITAKEAAELYPVTVPAHSRLFMCEFCGQYVLFTNEGKQNRHFRHNPFEKNKDCPERKFGLGTPFSAKDYELPIKITNIGDLGFGFEIGFIALPTRLKTTDLKIEIKSGKYESHVYSGERLSTSGITYLSIGDYPCREYNLLVTGCSDEIYEFWPKNIRGIDPEGTLFDASSRKKLVYDSDVEVNKKYYLLKRGKVSKENIHIKIEEICSREISWSTWYLYEVIAQDFDKYSACFFLEYHCRLTEKPISLTTVWPICIEAPYLLKHNRGSLMLYLTGNATVQVLPSAKYYKEGSLYEISCNSEKQLITAGRIKPLKYIYFWKENLNKVADLPDVSVTDIKENIVNEAKHNELPPNRILKVSAEFDGKIIVKKSGHIVEKIKLKSGQKSEIYEISWGCEINIFVGLDCVWKAEFSKKEKNIEIEEDFFLKELIADRGSMIRPPHSVRNILVILDGYTQIQNWLYKCIKNNSISELSFRKLQLFVLQIKEKYI